MKPGSSSEFLIANHLVIEPDQFDNAVLRRNEMVRLLRSVEGYLGFSVWHSREEADLYLALTHQANEASADRSMEVIGESNLIQEMVTLLARPADIHRMRVYHRQGEAPQNAANGSVLSLSHRVAEPGLGANLREELVYIFQELSVLPGSLGSLVAYDPIAEDVVRGFMLWEDVPSFEASLPRHMPYELTTYVRFM